MGQSTELRTRILLLVEDNQADAELVMDMLSSDDKFGGYEVKHVTRLSEAEAILSERAVDVVLLDLRLPDATGIDGLRSIHQIANDMPVVVLTGLEDEALAMECIDAGAQDYLSKDELKPAMLRRTIGYAITRLRETQLRELQTALANYRSLTSAGRKTSVTAGLSGMGAVRERHAEAYAVLTKEYNSLLEAYIQQLNYKKEKPAQLMAHLASRVGDLGGGPRDLLDIHVTALEDAIQGMSVERTRFYVVEGRLLALEMMGLLVDYYRVGQRRSGLGWTS